MNSIKVKTSAKINLTLDVIGKIDSGYHLIESIFQSVGIYDFLSVSKKEYGIILSCDTPGIPCDSSNIAYKAAKLFLDETGIDSGVKIHIEKHIPSQAGLGGGSSDGAGVLFALNRLFDTEMSISDLAEIGKKVSADTAFFLYGGTAFVQGTGEIIKSIRYIPPVNIVVAKGKSGISTPQAYKLIDSLENSVKIKTKKLLKEIDKGKFLKNCNCCGNIFEKVTQIEDVFSIKDFMKKHGAETAVMSGSGSAVFGIFNNDESAKQCAGELKKIYPFAEYCRAVTQSIEEIKT